MADTRKIQTTTTHTAIGTSVAYEDQANPRRMGAVESVTITRWGVEYTVKWDEPMEGRQDVISSSMTGTGWTIGWPQ